MNKVPNLKGKKFYPLPYESLESIGARLSWRNGVNIKQLIRYFSDENGSRDKEYNRQSQTDLGALVQDCGWVESSDKASSLYGYMALRKCDFLHTGFRFCPICLESAYHSFLFEWTFIQTCPLHSCSLTTACQSCGAIVKWRPKFQTLRQRGYRCLACRGYLAGCEPSLAEHLILRQHKTLIEARFRPYDNYAREITAALDLHTGTWKQFANMTSNRLRPWCDPDLIRRIGMHIRIWMAGRKGAAQYRGIMHLSWVMRLHSLDLDHGKREEMRRLAISRRHGVYRASLRRLEHWVFGCHNYQGAKESACARFFDDEDDGDKVGSWPPLVLAYLILRHTMEGKGFSIAEQLGEIKLSHFLATLESWRIDIRIERIALHAYVLGLFAIIHEILLRHRDWRVQELFAGTGFPAEHFVPIYILNYLNILNRDGAVFFPSIDGMPLWPFVRTGRELIEVPDPDGSERSVLAFNTRSNLPSRKQK